MWEVLFLGSFSYSALSTIIKYLPVSYYVSADLSTVTFYLKLSLFTGSRTITSKWIIPSNFTINRMGSYWRNQSIRKFFDTFHCRFGNKRQTEPNRYYLLCNVGIGFVPNKIHQRNSSKKRPIIFIFV